jgi:hypothetical protein
VAVSTIHGGKKPIIMVNDVTSLHELLNIVRDKSHSADICGYVGAGSGTNLNSLIEASSLGNYVHCQFTLLDRDHQDNYRVVVVVYAATTIGSTLKRKYIWRWSTPTYDAGISQSSWETITPQS